MPSETKTFQIQQNQPIRLDRFLAEQFAGISRAYLQMLIAEGVVQVNGRKARKGALLKAGDGVTIESFTLPEEREIRPNTDVTVPLVWDSEEICVVDKPAGLPTHPNDFSDQNSLANVLLGMFTEIQHVGDDRLRPGIVHRLDTNSSGLLLVAKTQEAFTYLRSLFDQRKVKKMYLALVLGEVKEEGEIATPIAHHERNPRKMVVVDKNQRHRSRAREAKTLFKPIENFDGYTLLEVRTLTGRMHQVRVHLSSVGHPLVGDKLYQNTKQRQQDSVGLERHFLHAAELEVEVVAGRGPEKFTSSLPSELKNSLESLA